MARADFGQPASTSYPMQIRQVQGETQDGREHQKTVLGPGESKANSVGSLLLIVGQPGPQADLEPFDSGSEALASNVCNL